jgi:hypothetical protein
MRTKNHILFRTAVLFRTPGLLGSAGLFRPLLLMILLALMPLTFTAAQDHTDQRQLTRSFPASVETTLEIQNKYGKIQVVPWEKDSVKVEVEIFLTESSSSKLRKLKEDIHINFTGTNSYIIASTVIDSERGRIASELKSISNTITGSNKRVEINYMVHLPMFMDVVLRNKFGDIYMDDLDGQVDIELSNGVLKANRLRGNAVLSLSFANGMIRSLGSANLKLSYSDLVVNEVSQLDLVSKSSKLNVDSVNVLKMDSRRDKLNFKHVEFFYGQSNFTQVWIYDFLRESDIYMKYGELTMEHVMPGFGKIYVESEYTDMTFYFDRAATLEFDILHHEKSILRLPGTEVLKEDTPSGKDYYKTVGTMGTGDPTGQLVLDALQKCFINISYK